MNNHYAKLEKEWKLLELQITQTRHPNCVVDRWTDWVDQLPDLLSLKQCRLKRQWHYIASLSPHIKFQWFGAGPWASLQVQHFETLLQHFTSMSDYPQISQQSVLWLPRNRPDKIWAERMKNNKKRSKNNTYPHFFSNYLNSALISLWTHFGHIKFDWLAIYCLVLSLF